MRKAITRNQLLISLAVISVILIPWMARSVVLSGLLVFPIYELDFFNVDWKLPESDSKICMSWIASCAKVKDIDDSFNLTIIEWFPIWYKNQNTLFLILTASVPVTGIVLLINRIKHIKKVITSYNSFLLTTWLINCIGVVFWFFSAPDFRFGIFSIIVCSVISIQFLINKSDLSTAILKRGSVLILIVFTVYSFKFPASYIVDGNLYLSQRLIVPEPLYKPVPVVKRNINGAIISFPVEDNRCWNEPVPCTCYENRFLKLRSSNIADGFKSVTD